MALKGLTGQCVTQRRTGREIISYKNAPLICKCACDQQGPGPQNMLTLPLIRRCLLKGWQAPRSLGHHFCGGEFFVLKEKIKNIMSTSFMDKALKPKIKIRLHHGLDVGRGKQVDAQPSGLKTSCWTTSRPDLENLFESWTFTILHSASYVGQPLYRDRQPTCASTQEQKLE